MNQSDADDKGAPAIRRILIAVDSSPASMQAVNWTRQVVDAQSRVLIVSVAQNLREFLSLGQLAAVDFGAANDRFLRDANGALVEASRIFEGSDVPVETQLLELAARGGDVAHALVETAEVWHADLLVVGARHHHGLLRWVEGTVSKPVTRLAACSILVVPGDPAMKITHGPQRILFAVDGSSASLQALRSGVQFASADAQVRAVYVVDRAVRMSDLAGLDPLAEAFLATGELALTRAAHLFSSLRCQTETALLDTEPRNDDVPHAIVREAARWGADLIVMGTHGRRGIARWLLGSIASRVASITQTPLLLVRAREQ